MASAVQSDGGRWRRQWQFSNRRHQQQQQQHQDQQSRQQRCWQHEHFEQRDEDEGSLRLPPCIDQQHGWHSQARLGCQHHQQQQQRQQQQQQQRQRQLTLVPAPAMLLVCLAVVQLCSWWSVGCEGLRVLVHRTECMEVAVGGRHYRLYGSVVVFEHHESLRDYVAPIDLKVSDPAGVQVYSRATSAELQFDLLAGREGDYRFCLHNRAHTPTWVDFDVDVEPPIEDDMQLEGEHAKDEHVDAVMAQIAHVQHEMRRLQVDQHYFRARASRQYETLASTHSRVFYFALIEAAVLIGASVLQVVLIRFLFERRRRAQMQH